MKNIIFGKAAIAVAIAGLLSAIAPSAKANLTINLSTPSVWLNQSSNPSVSDITTALGNAGWSTTLGSLLYKDERGQTASGSENQQFFANVNESGSLASSYVTTSGLANNNAGGFPIMIDYTGGTVADATYLLVKDGNLGSYVFDLSGWNGTDEIDIYNIFYPGKNDVTGVSHVEFFGSAATTSVPEPSTIVAGALLLLPFGVSTLRILRKGRSA